MDAALDAEGCIHIVELLNFIFISWRIQYTGLLSSQFQVLFS